MRGLERTRLCVTGSFGFGDVGDEAMLSEDLDFILSSLGIPRERISLIGDGPDYVSRYHGHPRDHCFSSSSLVERQTLATRKAGILQRAKRVAKRILRRGVDPSMPRLAAAAKRCNALLVTGGGTINTRDPAGYSLKRMHGLVGYFTRLGKPVFMSGQTVGPLGLNAEHDRLALEVVEAVDVLTVRDELYSKRYLDIVGAKPRRFVETRDDACALPYRDERLPEDICRFVAGGQTVAVNVTEYTSDAHEQRVFMSRLCEQLIRDHSMRVVLVGHTPGDLHNLHCIRDMTGNSVRNSMLLPDTRPWRGGMLKKLISLCRLAIGGRYHFIVFAATSDTPFVGMCGNHYSYIKQDGFARPLHLEEFVLTEREAWEMPTVISRIGKALSLELDVEEKVQRPSASMRLFGEWLAGLG